MRGSYSFLTKVISSYCNKEAFTVHKEIFFTKNNFSGNLEFKLKINKHKNTLFVVEDFKNELKKTKLFNKFLEKCKLNNSLIISDKDSKLKIIKSARNIPNLKIIDQEGTNIYDLLKYKNVIFTISSIKSLQERLSNEKN